MLDVKERNHLAVARRQGGDGALQVALRFLYLDPLLAGDGEVVGKLRSDAGLGSVIAPALRGQRQHRPAAAEEIDAVVPCDSQDPGGEGLARIEIADAGIGADERLLGSVARLFASAEEPEAETVDGLLVLLHQARKRGLVTAGGGARPLRLVGGAGRADQLSSGRQGQGQGKRECRVHRAFYGRQEGSISPQK